MCVIKLFKKALYRYKQEMEFDTECYRNFNDPQAHAAKAVIVFSGMLVIEAHGFVASIHLYSFAADEMNFLTTDLANTTELR